MSEEHQVAAVMTDALVPATEGSALGNKSGAAWRWGVWIWRIVLLAVIVGAWQLTSGRLISPFFISSPSSIVSKLGSWFSTGYIWKHVLITLKETVFGLALGGSAGIAFGFFLGRSRRVADVLNPFVTALYSLPKLALAPLLILWFGIGLLSKIVLVAMIVFFLVFYNAFAGARDVDELQVSVGKILGLNRRGIYTKIVIPSAMAWVVTGLRIAVPQSLIGAIVGELISSNRGLGYVIANASSFFDTTSMLAAIILVAILSLLFTTFVSRWEAWALRWKKQ